MGFVSDALFNDKRFRSLTVLDTITRENLAIEVDQGLKGEQVVAVLERLRHQRGVPKNNRVDNGPEFISKGLDRWAYENGVTLDFSRPGNPKDHAFIESSNGSVQDECLAPNWFLSLDDARRKIAAQRAPYNFRRPHKALDFRPPLNLPAKWAFQRLHRDSEVQFRTFARTKNWGILSAGVARTLGLTENGQALVSFLGAGDPIPG